MAKPTYDELYNLYRICELEREDLILENEELKDRIIKAIEYITNNMKKEYIHTDYIYTMIEILKGSDSNEIQ